MSAIALLLSGHAVLAFTACAQSHPERAANTRVPGELIAKAESQGSLRVIAQLQVPAVPEERRPQAIEQTRQLLIKELSGTSYRLIRSYTDIPAVALEVSAEALRVLAASRHVLRVSEDLLMAPFKKCADSEAQSGSPSERCQ